MNCSPARAISSFELPEFSNTSRTFRLSFWESRKAFLLPCPNRADVVSQPVMACSVITCIFVPPIAFVMAWISCTMGWDVRTRVQTHFSCCLRHKNDHKLASVNALVAIELSASVCLVRISGWCTQQLREEWINWTTLAYKQRWQHELWMYIILWFHLMCVFWLYDTMYESVETVWDNWQCIIRVVHEKVFWAIVEVEVFRRNRNLSSKTTVENCHSSLFKERQNHRQLTMTTVVRTS